MAFISLEIIFLKYKQVLNFAFFFFVYLLSGFISERSHNAFSLFEEGAIEHILSVKLWLYGLESVFWQNLTDCLLCLVVVLFVTA